MVKRDRKGKFLKGARRARRRRNPADFGALPVLLANPRRRVVKRRRRRSAVVVVNEPGSARSGRRSYKIRRLSNPKSGMGSMVRFALVGGGGILVARLAKYWINAIVGKVSTTLTQGMIGKLVQLAAMGLSAWGGSKLLCKVGIGSPADHGAFMIGGLAETGRTAVGTALALASPSTDRAKYGLDAPAEVPELPAGDAGPGTVYELDADGNVVALGDVVEEGTFGDVVEEGTFG